jgi:hypothetical protein
MSIELYEYKINNLEKELSNYKNKLKHLKIKETTLSQVINKYKQKLSLFSRFLEIKLNEKSKIEKMLTNLVNEVFDKNDELKLELTYDKDESLKGIKCLVSSDGENFGPILDSYGEGEVTVVVLILYFLLLPTTFDNSSASSPDKYSNSITSIKLLQSNNDSSISSSSSVLNIQITLTSILSDKNPSTICSMLVVVMVVLL